MEKNEVTFGTGIKVWCILCIVVGSLFIIPNFAAGYYFLAVFAIIQPLSYMWLLIGKKRLAFFVITAGAIIVFVINVGIYDLNIISALSGLGNPAITYALLSKYWHQMD